MIYMRNKQTGEIKGVERGTPEYHALQETRGPDGRPLYEQTSSAHATEVVERAEAGALREQDLGEQDKPLAPVTATVGEADPAPWVHLTAGERKVGLTEEKKEEQVAAMFSGSEERAAGLSAGAEKISGSDNPKKGSAATQPGQYDSLSRKDAKAEADLRGIELPSNAKVGEIRQALTDYDTQAGSGAPA